MFFFQSTSLTRIAKSLVMWKLLPEEVQAGKEEAAITQRFKFKINSKILLGSSKFKVRVSSKFKIVVVSPDDRVIPLANGSRCEYLGVGKRGQRRVFPDDFIQRHRELLPVRKGQQQ